MPTKYISYLRVSTDKQGDTGFSIEDQRQSVARFIQPGDTIVKEFTEVESAYRKKSGKHTRYFRPALNKAIDLCTVNQYTLLVARLDRLARDMEFTSALMNSAIKFVCCDMPFADNFTIHIIAALAERESEQKSIIIKSGMKIAQEKGTKSGKPIGGIGNWRPGYDIRPVSALGGKFRTYYFMSDERNKKAFALVKALRHSQSKTARRWVEIVKALNEAGYRPPSGRLYDIPELKRLWIRFTSPRHIKDNQFVIDYLSAKEKI